MIKAAANEGDVWAADESMESAKSRKSVQEQVAKNNSCIPGKRVNNSR